ncbi:MAG: TIGR01777 family protein [Nitrospirae bacterium]|nr:TIGR01777 family protein [Nitrospirota bacterium]
MNILITGGTGFIGSALGRELSNSGHKVIIASRRKTPPKLENIEIVRWDIQTPLSSEIMSGIDAVINLAGESLISGRWTEKRKERIMSSRVNTTRLLVESMKNANPKPKVLISVSAVGYYGPHGNEYVTEDAPPASDFLAEVCKAWEKEALRAQESGVRVVITRFGVVLESDGGALSKMAIPFKFFLGGHLGSGQQWFSWVHREDIIGFMKYALENESVSGHFNLTSPQPVTNKEFCSALGKALNRPSWFHVPAFMIKLTLGEVGKVLLTGQRVLPEKALKAGYQFKYPEINEALRAIYGEK